MQYNLNGRVYVVTGSTKGIGRRIAEVIGEHGGKAVVCGRDAAAGESTVEAIRTAGGDGMYVDVEISEVEQCRHLIEITESTYGRLDGLINNAAIFPDCRLQDVDEATFDHVFDVNIKGAFFCTQFAIDALRRSGGGVVINIGTTHAWAGNENRSVYACSKGALHTLTHHVAKNYARHNIRSNWVTVGWVITPGELDYIATKGRDREWLERQGKERMPLGRLQTPDDIASGVLYLVSDAANQVTGTDLHITGGFLP